MRILLSASDFTNASNGLLVQPAIFVLVFALADTKYV